MITITFPNSTTERRAVAFLLGRFPGKVVRPGVHLLCEEAVEALAAANISYAIKTASHKPRPGESPADVIAAPRQRRRQKPGKPPRKLRD